MKQRPTQIEIDPPIVDRNSHIYNAQTLATNILNSKWSTNVYFPHRVEVWWLSDYFGRQGLESDFEFARKFSNVVIVFHGKSDLTVECFLYKRSKFFKCFE